MERRVPYLVKAAPRPSAGVLVVGIDPGEVTGMAAWDVGAQSFVHVGSGSFFEVLDLLDEWLGAAPPAAGWSVSLVVVEDARRLPIYASRDCVRGRRRDRLCRSVGRIDRDVQLWVDWLRVRALPVRLAEPLRGGKWDAATLARLSGWTEPTNQHARDAGRLVFGTTARHVETWGGVLSPTKGDAPGEAEGVS